MTSSRCGCRRCGVLLRALLLAGQSLLLLLVGLLPVLSFAQAEKSATAEWVAEEARKTMASVEFPRLTTFRQRDGYPLERPVHPKPPNWMAVAAEGTINGKLEVMSELSQLHAVHFPVHKESKLMEELLANPAATLVYRDEPPAAYPSEVEAPAGSGVDRLETSPYANVTLSGVLRVCEAEEAAAVWFEKWRRAYPQGAATSYYAAVRFEPRKFELSTLRVRYVVEEWRGWSGWRTGLRVSALERGKEKRSPWVLVSR